ncbi:FapA family protein [Amphibacillus jilinensis]|uniref:FapA family protein n=1 Tax=Amphibacillus jilinensis TaxID=1216008 RepID=UPI0002F87972|nr:FapA family protein [Amphibacillus jilinensis]
MDTNKTQRKLVDHEYFSLWAEEHLVLIAVSKQGFNLLDFNSILAELPMIKISNFMQLKQAIENATNEPVVIGEAKPIIEVILSKDLLEASIKLNLLEEEIEVCDHKHMVSEILKALETAGVTDGILPEVLKNELPFNEKVVIARGAEPVDGKGAQVRYIELSEKRPQINEDHSANFYEMNLIDEVAKGDWLGEKIIATEGTPGWTVTGEILPAKKGNESLFKFDPKSVKEVKENGAITLYAKKNGAVVIENGKIKVDDMLVITGDVGVDTGNIEFDGSIKITGTVTDSFSVTATKDISILNPLGIGGIDKIISRQGDVYIQGGVFGKGTAYIEAAQNVYIKHANECTIVAGNEINIGYYSIGSDLMAKKVVLDQHKGKIIGGSVKAKVQVISAFIGNQYERETEIKIEGFNRLELKQQLEALLKDYKKRLIELEKVNRELEVYETYFSLQEESDGKVNALKEYENNLDVQEKLSQEVFMLEKQRQVIVSFLETKGEGEIQAIYKAYPETTMQIKNIQKKLKKSMTGMYYVKKGKLFFE